MLLEGGVFQNDVTSLYDGMVGLRDFVASKYKLAVGIMNNPTDFSQKQIEEARKNLKKYYKLFLNYKQVYYSLRRGCQD